MTAVWVSVEFEKFHGEFLGSEVEMLLFAVRTAIGHADRRILISHSNFFIFIQAGEFSAEFLEIFSLHFYFVKLYK